jgi:hypothetical protein
MIIEQTCTLETAITEALKMSSINCSAAPLVNRNVSTLSRAKTSLYD